MMDKETRRKIAELERKVDDILICIGAGGKKLDVALGALQSIVDIYASGPYTVSRAEMFALANDAIRTINNM